MKVYIETYGCVANQVDSEIISGILASKGIKVVGDYREADVVIINSCSVKQPTEFHMLRRMKFFRNKKLVAAGCLPQSSRELVELASPGASLVSPSRIGEIADVVLAAAAGKRTVALGIRKEEKICLPALREGGIIAKVSIAEGCLGACSFCSTKLARGHLFSYRKEKIVETVRDSLAKGFREIWLTAQDCSVYGLDAGTSLAGLLESISRLEGEFRVRVGMMNPFYFLKDIDSLLAAFEDSRIYKFFHVPVQSGNSAVLKDMRREYSPDDFLEICAKIRKKFPEATISTDVIVGFPTESEPRFRDSLKLVEKSRPDILNISRFSPRPNTEAARMRQITGRLVKERSRKLTELHGRIAQQINKNLVGKNYNVLADEITKKGLMGRNDSYKPVALPAGLQAKESALGQFIYVRITGATRTYLVGEPV